jgi:hypothetical protein
VLPQPLSGRSFYKAKATLGVGGAKSKMLTGDFKNYGHVHQDPPGERGLKHSIPDNESHVICPYCWDVNQEVEEG